MPETRAYSYAGATRDPAHADERHERLRRRGAAARLLDTSSYGNGTVRKTVLLVLLAAIWEIYARALANPLLFPTFTDTVMALLSGSRRRRDTDGRALHALVTVEGLRRGLCSSRRC